MPRQQIVRAADDDERIWSLQSPSRASTHFQSLLRRVFDIVLSPPKHHSVQTYLPPIAVIRTAALLIIIEFDRQIIPCPADCPLAPSSGTDRVPFDRHLQQKSVYTDHWTAVCSVDRGPLPTASALLHQVPCNLVSPFPLLPFCVPFSLVLVLFAFPPHNPKSAWPPKQSSGHHKSTSSHRSLILDDNCVSLNHDTTTSLITLTTQHNVSLLISRPRPVLASSFIPSSQHQ